MSAAPPRVEVLPQPPAAPAAHDAHDAHDALLRPLVPSELVDPSFGQNCIGCSPRNVKGLHLRFEARGREVRAELALDRSYESYPGMIHGGIIALILDEVTGRAALWHARTFVMTLGIRLRYAAIMQPGVRCIARAEVEAATGDQLRVSGVLEEAGSGRLIATAAGTFAALRGERLAALAADLPEATRALALELAALGDGAHAHAHAHGHAHAHAHAHDHAPAPAPPRERDHDAP